jgi:hypothetical protein
MAEQIRYGYKNINLSELEAKLDELWVQLQQESALATEATKQGISLGELRGKKRNEVIEVRKEGEGFDPATTALIVAFSPLVAKVAKDLWTNILLPRILKAKGKDALTPKEKKKR